MTQRTDRVDQLLREEIGQLLAREVADPRIGFVTITDVETTPDLHHAKVWVSVIGTPEERKEATRALAHAMPFIRRELGKRLRIRRIPDLHIVTDDTFERGTRVLHLLAELAEGADSEAVLEVAEAPLPTPVPRLRHDGDGPEPEPGLPAIPPPDSGGRGRGNGGRGARGDGRRPGPAGGGSGARGKSRRTGSR